MGFAAQHPKVLGENMFSIQNKKVNLTLVLFMIGFSQVRGSCVQHRLDPRHGAWAKGRVYQLPCYAMLAHTAPPRPPSRCVGKGQRAMWTTLLCHACSRSWVFGIVLASR